MPIETDQDRLEFFDPDEFGVAATYAGQAINGLFLDSFEQADFGAGASIESIDPVFVGRASDLVAVAHGSTITIAGTIWTIRGIRPDGEGMIRLDLADEN